MDSESAEELSETAEPEPGVGDTTGALEVLREKIGFDLDRIHLQREVNFARMVVAAATQVRASGLPIQAVRDRFVRAVLEAGADEDDPDLYEAWTNLLANALTDAAPVARAYPEILRQLEPVEARILSATATCQETHLPGSWVELRELSAVPDEIQWRHFDNLERLNLLTFHTSYPNNVELPDPPPRDAMEISLAVTALGAAFLRACTPLAPSE